MNFNKILSFKILIPLGIILYLIKLIDINNIILDIIGLIGFIFFIMGIIDLIRKERKRIKKKKYELKASTGRFNLKQGEVSFKIKRGDASWAMFPIAYTILLTIILSIISYTTVNVLYKVVAAIFISLGLFYLCFFGSTTRNKILTLFMKSKNFIEKK